MYSLVEINYLFVYLVIITDILDLHSLDVYTVEGTDFFWNKCCNPYKENA